MATPLTGLNSVNASGMIPASGTAQVGATSGPWMIEEQELTIYYTRVPSYKVFNDVFGLSSVSNTTKVEWTYIQNRVEAEYTKSYSTDLYSTSSWTQPQKFEYHPVSSDAYGNSYGNTGVSALGPVGTITTKDKWYHRRAWDAAVDFQVAEDCEATTHYFSQLPQVLNAAGGGTQIQVNPAIDGMSYFGEFGRLDPKPFANHTFVDGDSYYHRGDQEYIIFGPYNTSAETPLAIQTYVDGIGSKVEQLDMFGVNGGEGILPNPAQPNVAFRNTGCQSYDNNRHDWT
jgi:hypothetical protein